MLQKNIFRCTYDKLTLIKHDRVPKCYGLYTTLRFAK